VLNGWEVSSLVTTLAVPVAWFIEALVVLHKKTFARDRYGPGAAPRPSFVPYLRTFPRERPL
jgi:hypothetical protein